uniref:Uncharacterized protein n=1 Tax=Oryza glumipatula TaxID=40148 RepID=A0A0E0AMN2_9ORYZ
MTRRRPRIRALLSGRRRTTPPPPLPGKKMPTVLLFLSAIQHCEDNNSRMIEPITQQWYAHLEANGAMPPSCLNRETFASGRQGRRWPMERIEKNGVD